MNLDSDYESNSNLFLLLLEKYLDSSESNKDEPDKLKVPLKVSFYYNELFILLNVEQNIKLKIY